jgi:tRNA U34 5-methylaminomethyl-2-thiouridine-forming methyltransferase MnmC
MKVIKKITADNSPTLYVPELDEHYHSINGAVQESQHIFINAGLKQINKKKIKILEIGFGTGLNALLTFSETQKNKQPIIRYTGIEKYPVPLDIIEVLLKENIPRKDIFKQIHKTPWENETAVSDFFSLKKIKVDLKTFMPEDSYDLIYFDAFAPDKQPELWTKNIFVKLFNATDKNGILVTYSAKGIVKQALRNAGYFVKRLPGPPGKRHMVEAIKK